MFEEHLKITHNVTVELLGPDGELKERREIHNLVPTAGKNAVAEQLLAEPGKAKPTHLAIGKGNTAPVEGDTKLKEELARVALASKTRENNVVTLVGEVPAGEGTGNVVEAGLLNAASNGDLYTRAVFGVITKEAADAVKITWKTTVG